VVTCLFAQVGGDPGWISVAASAVRALAADDVVFARAPARHLIAVVAGRAEWIATASWKSTPGRISAQGR